MISRVADHCFWLGRYLERVESTARVLSVTSNLSLDAELTQEQCWLPVVIVSGEREAFIASHGTEGTASGDTVQRYMTWEEANLTSIWGSIHAARFNSRSIREVVSLEAWEAINEAYLWVRSPEALEEYDRDRFGFYRRVRRGAQLAFSLFHSTMLRDDPLYFIWLGVSLERVGQTARVLDVHHHAFTTLPSRHQVVETALWLSLLRACSGFESFMKRNRGLVTGDAVAAFLLFEPAFPRSVVHTIHSAHLRLSSIRPATDPSYPGAATAARLEELDEWIQGRAALPVGQSLHEVLTHVVNETAAICEGLSHELFGFGPEPAPKAPLTTPLLSQKTMQTLGVPST
jgi:uncharacterized alpha-E superfamily protein